MTSAHTLQGDQHINLFSLLHLASFQHCKRQKLKLTLKVFVNICSWTNAEREWNNYKYLKINIEKVWHYFKEEKRVISWFLQVCIFTCNHNHFKIAVVSKYLPHFSSTDILFQENYCNVILHSRWKKLLQCF